ncbi:MAG: valine--tRNA ligase [Eubacteriales bacterium]
MKTNKELAKTYDPSQVEDRVYKSWLENNYFHATISKEKEPFTIVIPPPNITGQLHMGHALDNTWQDIIIRYKRMQGYSTLWLPGTDHASIATEVKIVEQLADQGISKHDLGREGFLEKAWEWKEKYGSTIVNQLKKLGSSCDWDRERFTMDEGCSHAVNEVFVNLYNKGLIYQGDRIINWCPECKTALSDAEVEYEEKQGSFWHIAYPIKDSNDRLVVATTRPETMLGDTAVAVNPDDERYQHLIGKTVILPLVNREIPIIADSYVDSEFGTGVVKITPAHDPNDFEVGLRHDLPQIRVLDDDGTMNSEAGSYEGMDRYEARKAIVKDLEELGLLEKTEAHSHNVGECYRCTTVVEPIISKQWFVKMKPLAEPAIEAVRSGKTRFVPKRFEKTYFNWMENIRDWCISRQLWWGHRIPAYYCLNCNETIVAKQVPSKCSCGHDEFRQDEDVLDTWFSSALWPFSTLGWPEKTEDLDYFYPTSVLVTGYDIIFFWVARMIFSGLEHTGQVPFKDVLIHGMVRDSQGRKMSKSLGNGVDPLEIIDEYGADALRMSLIVGSSPGNDMRFHIEKVEASRNFANKIWNATRFIMMNLENMGGKDLKAGQMDLADRWIISRYNRLVGEVTENLDKYELGIAAQKVYDFIWNEYCDWYIELVKPRLYGTNEEARSTALYTLVYVLSNTLKLLHPFMPFISEEIWQHLSASSEDSIMVSSWPRLKDEELDDEAEARMDSIMDTIRAVRNIRAEMDVHPSRKTKLIIVAKEDKREIFEEAKVYLEKLAYASEITINEAKDELAANAVPIVVDIGQIYIPLEDLVDFKSELDRLEKEKAKLEGELNRVNGKLSNPNFVEKAPAAIVKAEEEKKAKYEDMMASVLEQIDKIRKMME